MVVGGLCFLYSGPPSGRANVVSAANLNAWQPVNLATNVFDDELNALTCLRTGGDSPVSTSSGEHTTEVVIDSSPDDGTLKMI